MNRPTFRRPVSVLIVVYKDAGNVLLLRRSKPFDFWQSVTGSVDAGEKHAQAAVRELQEETGLSNEGELRFSGLSRQFVIDSRWRHKYQPGIVENVEFEWRYRLSGAALVRVRRDEHSEFGWFSIDDAIDKVWSWTNREALRQLRLELVS